MKVIGYTQSLPVSAPQALIETEMTKPGVSGEDLLVKVHGIGVNPVDYKIRQHRAPEPGQTAVLGWDGAGEVMAVGDRVRRFKPGDQVFYAGDLNRQGSNAEYQLVDERLVGHKPKSLSHAQAAALPLTSITAWELLFEHLGIEQINSQGEGQVSQESHQPVSRSRPLILVVGAAGGVGSILIQLIKTLTDARVIATASRVESQAWVKELGADYVIDHRQNLTAQIEALALGKITHVASLAHTDSYMASYVEVLAPFGRIAMIDDPQELDVRSLKPKSLSLHWEFMFARSMFQAEDMQAQGALLNQVSRLVDEGKIRTTVGTHLGQINAANLRQAHQLLESGKSIGKIVLEGF